MVLWGQQCLGTWTRGWGSPPGTNKPSRFSGGELWTGRGLGSPPRGTNMMGILSFGRVWALQAPVQVFNHPTGGQCALGHRQSRKQFFKKFHILCFSQKHQNRHHGKYQNLAEHVIVSAPNETVLELLCNASVRLGFLHPGPSWPSCSCLRGSFLQESPPFTSRSGSVRGADTGMVLALSETSPSCS